MRGLLYVLIPVVTSSCIFTSEDPETFEPLGGSRTVEGTVVDFESGQALAAPAPVSTSGLLPEPRISVQGSSFKLEGVPENSAFQIKAFAERYRGTYSEAVIVGTEDVRGVMAPAVSEAFLMGLATGFGVTPTAGRGILIARVVNDAGQPKAGVAKANFALDASVTGPFFLGDNRQPLPNATATSGSGWVVWFEVTPGVATLGLSASATATLDMPVSPIAAGTVTVAKIRATDGAPALPTNVSFRDQILPIFQSVAEGGRGCVACHSGNGIGRELGGLKLDGGAPPVYRELVEEDPLRVQPLMAEKSQLLTYPSREDPPDRHPNATFTGPLDRDYLKILVWIKEGAKDN